MLRCTNCSIFVVLNEAGEYLLHRFYSRDCMRTKTQKKAWLSLIGHIAAPVTVMGYSFVSSKVLLSRLRPDRYTSMYCFLRHGGFV